MLLAGCGGSGERPERLVRGSGYHFRAPAGWTVVRSGREVRAASGVSLVSVTRYTLLRAFRSSRFERVVPELDRAADGLARQQHGTVGTSRTLTVAGTRARSYDIDYRRAGRALVERIAFALRGKTEYLLLCRYERGGDTAACDRLVATFTLG